MSADPHLVRDVFLSAASLPPEGRERYLNDRCGDDLALRAEVERLLAADQAIAAVLDVDATDDEPRSLEKTAPETAAAHGEGRSEWPAQEPGLAATDGASGPARPSQASNGFVPGQVVAGRYTLLELLGEGGMGSVYRAEQNTPVKRLVALKVIRTGVDSRKALARFDAERQALALMDHPNIARVYDGGATEHQQPFFVMELVRGTPITDYCDEKRLSIPARLELFVAVCQAVQHAHQKGIIHRDLKPSNVLVTEIDGRATPKVIDFGVAKAVEFNLTDQSIGDTGAVVGTPAYMSPEQADPSSMDIDTRTDVYALGVVLYELLTGSPPLDPSQFQRGAWLEMLRMVREVDPPKPSTKVSTAEELPNIAARRDLEPTRLRQALSGDLDWIVMKALEKDRERRYETANGLAADVLRHLANEPVLAAPPGRVYRMRKFVRKHRSGAIAASLVLLALLAGMAGTTWGMVQARQARDAEASARRRAEAERHRAERSEALAKQQRKRAEDREEQAIDAVKRFRDSVANEPELKNNPALEALRKRLLKEPLAFFKALRDRLQADKDTRPESLVRLAQACHDLGMLTVEIGDQRDALLGYREALAIYRKLVDEHPAVIAYQGSLIDCHLHFGDLLRKTGKSAEAMKEYEAAREGYQKWADRLSGTAWHQSGLAGIHEQFGTLLSETGKPAEALEEFESARAVFQKLADADPADTSLQKSLADSNLRIGNLLRDIGRPAEALKAYEAMRTIVQKLIADQPADAGLQNGLAAALHNSANLLRDIGRSAEALKAFEAAVAINQKLADASPTVTEFQDDLARDHGSMGVLLSQTGKLAEALKAHEAARASFQKLADANPAVTAFQGQLAGSNINIGILLSETGKPAEAMKAYEAARAIYQKLIDANPTVARFRRGLAIVHNDIGFHLGRNGKPAEAMKEHESARAIFQKLADANPTVIQYQRGLANAGRAIGEGLCASGKPAEAMKEYETARAIFQKLVDANPTIIMFQDYLALVHGEIGHLLQETGKPDEALKAYESARAIRRKLADAHPGNAGFQSDLAIVHGKIGRLSRKAGDTAEARKEFQAALAIVQKIAHEHPESADLQSRYGARSNDLAVIDIEEKRFERARERLQEAIEHQRKALATAPAKPVYRRFLMNHYANLVMACRGLNDAAGAAEAREELARLRDSDPANRILDARLDAILKGTGRPKDQAERLALARRAYEKSLHATAVRLWAEAFAGDPQLADTRGPWHRYNAACAAAQAGCGGSKDQPAPDEAAKARLRKQALEWLEDEHAVNSKQFAADGPNARRGATQRLEHWRSDPDLAGIRDEQELAKLPEAERAAFRRLWADVDNLIAQARSRTGGPNEHDQRK